MNFDVNKYIFVEHTSKNGSKQVTAISSYAGKTVKGYAKCDPNDEYFEGSGMVLAAARCNEKIAKKRVACSEARLNEAREQLKKAEKLVADMIDYHNDAINKYAEAQNEVEDILSEFAD